ncbi:MAG: thioredoxin family protein [Planctomycetaceae bacterium]|jgi:thiol-disulfide isomerase/thioredoxin|nr:thioredoxin family protein [Planctomycetaceae bacterium]
MDYAAKFADGLDYRAFLDKYATPEQLEKWNKFSSVISLTDDQQKLLSGFVREMKVIVMAGAWCGDCVNQCPIFHLFAQATDQIQLRFFDRDDNPDLAEELSTCGGARVPAVLFLSEDNFVCGRAGDRTLSKYRVLVDQLDGAACSSGIAIPGDQLTLDVIQDWLNEFERIQGMLRTSGRLRKLHND